MEPNTDSGIVKVLDAYTRVLVGMSRGVIYLFFVTASTISGALTGLAFLLLGSELVAGLVGLASFSITFGFSIYISIFLGRLQGSYNLQGVPAEQRAKVIEDWRSTGKRIGMAWGHNHTLIDIYRIRPSITSTNTRYPYYLSFNERGCL
jgi:hypothetical protein